MSFTYSDSAISPTSGAVISAIRWIIQDTIEAEAEVQDEAITALYNDTDTTLTQEYRVYVTSSAIAQVIVRKYKKIADFSSGGTSVQAQKRAEAWQEVADRLSAQVAALVSESAINVISAYRPALYY